MEEAGKGTNRLGKKSEEAEAKNEEVETETTKCMQGVSIPDPKQDIALSAPVERTTGKKTIKIQKTRNEKNRVTDVLEYAGNGTDLKPMVMFKRKTVPRVANKHGVVITAQEKGCMDTEGMKH